MKNPLQDLDSKEITLPDTTFIHDIESRVFQAIAYQCILKIEGIAPLEGGLIDSFLGSQDRLKGIVIEQDQKNHSINLKVEINVAYGVSLPKKAEEIQTLIAHEISRLTGLHVSFVHVVFKNLIAQKDPHKEQAAHLSRLEM